MKENFWSRGLRFDCQRSGKCCTNHGSNTYVYVELDERRRMAAVLGMRTAAFTRNFCQKSYGRHHVKDRGEDCILLDNGGCSVYEARPTQCRTWPFWPENMDPTVWKKEITAFCPGIGKGKLHSAEEIDAQLKASEA
ncbi:MAG: YkgJ family cysteine cluster protein [Myxococcota bacterium]